jgi:hypothetical protein
LRPAAAQREILALKKKGELVQLKKSLVGLSPAEAGGTEQAIEANSASKSHSRFMRDTYPGRKQYPGAGRHEAAGEHMRSLTLQIRSSRAMPVFPGRLLSFLHCRLQPHTGSQSSPGSNEGHEISPAASCKTKLAAPVSKYLC